jgi:hypothetical protein
MKGKYSNVIQLAVAKLYRANLRRRLSGLVEWPSLTELKSGCTAIIAMPHRLPDVLAATLKFLTEYAWKDLVEIVVCVDSSKNDALHLLERELEGFGYSIPIKLVYYTDHQVNVAGRLNLPYVYSWLSWSVALSYVKTENFFIQDYDALPLSNLLSHRYQVFVESDMDFQGVSWYEANGIEQQAFSKTDWVRRLRPIDLFNAIGVIEDRTVDFDTFLQAQRLCLDVTRRGVYPMGQADLIHPSQMIHQYTMFRRYPGRALPCFSVILIPFFSFLGGNRNALIEACASLRSRRGHKLEFLHDGTVFNFQKLQTQHVDWALKQMLQGFTSIGMSPSAQVFAYGELLYDIVFTPSKDRWINNFEPNSIKWIQLAAHEVGAS